MCVLGVMLAGWLSMCMRVALAAGWATVCTYAVDHMFDLTNHVLCA